MSSERIFIRKLTEALRKIADDLYGESALLLAIYMSRESLEGDFFLARFSGLTQIFHMTAGGKGSGSEAR